MQLATLAEFVTTYNESVIDKCTTGIVLAQDPSGTLIVEHDVYEQGDRQGGMRIHSRRLRECEEKENRQSLLIACSLFLLHYVTPIQISTI